MNRTTRSGSDTFDEASDDDQLFFVTSYSDFDKLGESQLVAHLLADSTRTFDGISTRRKIGDAPLLAQSSPFVANFRRQPTVRGGRRPAIPYMFTRSARPMGHWSS